MRPPKDRSAPSADVTRASSASTKPVAFPRPLPTRSQLAALDVDGFVRRLDRNLDAITNDSSLDALLPPDAVAAIGDPRFAQADKLFRSTLRGTLVATSFRDLPVEGRVHPAVQDRMWSAMDEMDAAVQGIADTLGALTKAERAEISEVLREQPDLGDRLVAALEAEAERAGVSDERRAHLRAMGKHACFRLRQSASGFIDEYTAKIRKVKARPVDEAERYLAAQMGDAAFEKERRWQRAVELEWQKVLAEQSVILASPEGEGGSAGGISADDAYAPPAGGESPPAIPPGVFIDPNRGKTVLKVGAWLFGLGVLSGCTGGLLVSTDQGDAVIAGLVAFTAAAVLGFVGLICLMIGAILRVYTRSQMKALGATY